MPKFTGDASGINKLNGYLSGFSYVTGHSFSEDDREVFATFSGAPDAAKHPHAFRWYIHIAALTGLGSFAAPAAAAAPAKSGGKKKAAADDDDDDMDLFDDDDEEDAKPSSRAEQAKALKAKKDKETAEKKQAALDRLAKKEAKQRSLCNLEIKPWEAEQDLNDLFKRIKEKVKPEGLKWSENCKLVEVAFGVKKMLLTAVLPMNLSMDAIIEDMTEDIFADEIQSMNMTSMSLL